MGNTSHQVGRSSKVFTRASLAECNSATASRVLRDWNSIGKMGNTHVRLAHARRRDMPRLPNKVIMLLW